MAGKNDAVFDFANEVVFDTVIQAAGRSAEDFRRELLKFLTDFMKSFYSELVVENIGNSDGPSGLMSGSSYYAPWNRLSEAYYDQKIRNNRSTGFYENTGKLKQHLLGRDAIKDFGKPKVTMNAEGKGVASNVFIDRAGRPQYRKGSGKRGFAAFSSAFAEIQFILEVQMFPKMQGKNLKSVFNIFPMQDNIRYKLAVNEFGRTKMAGKAVNHPARPLLRPFLDWYGSTNLRLSLSERFGV